MSNRAEAVLINLCWTSVLLLVVVVVAVAIVRYRAHESTREWHVQRSEFDRTICRLEVEGVHLREELAETRMRLTEVENMYLTLGLENSATTAENHELRAAIRRWEEQS